MCDKRIPKGRKLNTENIRVQEEKEPFVEVSSYTRGKILVDMQYKKAGREGAIELAYLRKAVVDKLLCAIDYLPKGYTFKIFDGWRPFAVQKSLYDEYYNKLKEKEPYLPEEELREKAKTFVSFPDKSKKFSYVHSSGGAVDLTVVDEKGEELSMATPFDDFSLLSNTDALEDIEGFSVERENRRILYYAMTRVGFTNYPSEWWHYDYGDIFWGATTGEPVKYSSVYTKEEMILGNTNGEGKI